MKQDQNIPAKTLERLVLYRHLLKDTLAQGIQFIFSHQLAAMAHNTAAQVRRDLMLTGYQGTARNGYEISALLSHISTILHYPQKWTVALAGAGHLGTALLAYFSSGHSELTLAASFDIDKNKIGHVIAGCRCYSMTQLEKQIREMKIDLGIITVPADQAQEVADRMTRAGLRGILNFAPVRIQVPPDVFVERFDLAGLLEKVALSAGIK